MGVRIIATGKALPKLRVDNDRIKDFVDTDSEWITSRTGIEARHVAEEETALDISVQAARQAKVIEAIEVLYARSKTIKPLDICPLPAPQSIQKFYCEKVSVK